MDFHDIILFLDKSAYEAFEDAWLQYYGIPVERNQLDADFGYFLQTDEMPLYVKHWVQNPPFMVA